MPGSRSTRAMIHEKMFVVDGKWSFIGAANMDVRSRELNPENVLGAYRTRHSPGDSRGRSWRIEHAQEITLEEGAPRGDRPVHFRASFPNILREIPFECGGWLVVNDARVTGPGAASG